MEDKKKSCEIDWNTASELGLVERINREILHPLGLAMTREPATGISPFLMVARDGIFEYRSSYVSKIKTDEEIETFLEQLRKDWNLS